MSGWRIVAAAAVAVGAMVAGILGVEGTGDGALSAALRATASTSFALFLPAVVASSLHSLANAGWTKWLVRNRRFFGVAFAVSHFIHLGLIGARAAGHSEAFFAERTVASLVPGMIAYGFIAAMTITSFRGPTRALGRRNWKILHKTGIYIIAVIFAVAHARGANYAALALLAVAMTLRAAARSATILNN